MSRSLLRPTALSINICCSYAASPNVDHYAILGLEPGASSKEVKSAYYKLSKQHHPDTNPDKKEEAAKKFHEVAQAYEVLGSPEQKKIYDMTRIRTNTYNNSGPGGRYQRNQQPTKKYTDIDIDYQTFEQFQRNTRRRKQYHSHFEMPEEFYAEFGGKKRVYKSEFDEATEKVSSMYKDSRAMEREKRELEEQIRREQERLQNKYPIPTFEQMMQEKRLKEQSEQRKYLIGLITAAGSGMLLFLIIRN